MKHVDLSTEFGEAVPQFLDERLDPFRTAFTEPTWRHASVLAMGALLAPGKRTVSSCLRITGNVECKSFSSFHQVLNRAQWEPSELSRILLQLLVTNLVEEEPIVVGLDDTIERRWGPKIDARGIYRDPVRSSRGHFVKTSGLRWLGFTLLTPLPWKTGIKALPFQTLLAPSERYASKRGLKHKKLTDWARQGMLQTIRWLPKRKVIFVGDSSFGTHELANSISKHGTLISRLRLDANLFELPPETNKRGRPRIKGEPLPKLTSYLNAADECWTKVTPSHWYGAKEKTLEIISGTGLWYRTGTPPTLLRWVLVRDPDGKMEPQAFFCTDTDMDPAEVISNFAKRWEMEVTFQEVRTHLGVETQRQWSKNAIARTTPALLGLYSLVCLWGQQALEANRMSYAAAWYEKTNFTFSDAIAVVRCEIFLSHSPPDRECDKNQSRLYQRAHEIILFWDAKLFHSGSNSGTPWHLKKGLSHALVDIIQTTAIRALLPLIMYKVELMPLLHKLLLRKRSIIETLFDKLKSHMGLEHSRHRSAANAFVHILSCIAAYVLAQPKVKMGNIVVPDVIRSIANAT